MDERSRLRGCEGYGIRFDDIPSPSCFAIHLPRGGRLRRGIASADAKIPRFARNDRKTERLPICHSEARSDEESFPARRRTHRSPCGAGGRSIRARVCHPVFAGRRAGGSGSPVMPYISAMLGALAYLLSDFAGPPGNHRRPRQTNLTERPVPGVRELPAAFWVLCRRGQSTSPAGEISPGSLSGKRGRHVWRPYGFYCKPA